MRAVKRRGVLAETWSSWYGAERNISVEGVRTRLLKRIRRGTIAGIFLSPPSHSFSRARRGKVVAMIRVQKGFSWLESSVREAVSRANNFANACVDIVIKGIKQGIPPWTLTAAWVTFVQLLRTGTGVNLVADFEDAPPFGTGTWKSQECCRPAIHVAESPVGLSSRINTADNDLNRPERQVITLSRGACVTLPPGS